MKMIYAKMLTVLFTVAAFIGLVMCGNSAEAANDWAASNNSIEVTGEGMAPPNAANAVHGRMLARRAAIADCYRQLAEMVEGVQVSAGTDVAQMMAADDSIRLRVNATIKGATVVDEKDPGDGSYRVTMRMPIFGSSNSLAQAVMPQPQEPPTNFPAPTANVKVSGGYTGLIVDCRGLNLKPVMSPVILNARNEKIYGYKNLDYDKVIAQGMAGYSYSLTSGVDRAGSNPLIVKAVKLENHNGNPVVSVSDADLILSENNVSHFLDKTNVVFIR